MGKIRVKRKNCLEHYMALLSSYNWVNGWHIHGDIIRGIGKRKNIGKRATM